MTLDSLNSPRVFIEITSSVLRVLEGERGAEWPIERMESGSLSAASREKLATELKEFLRRPTWLPRRRALCAIGLRGVSLRRMKLPAANDDEMQRILLLQLENEFPLSPDELAWGFRRVSGIGSSGNGAPAVQELLVAAVKKDALAEYERLFSESGLACAFTLGAMARGEWCAAESMRWSVLEIGQTQSELICFEHGTSDSIRVLAWGEDDVARALESGEANSFATQLRQERLGEKLFVTGTIAQLGDFVPLLAAVLTGVECEYRRVEPGPGHSAATLGLQKSAARNGDAPIVILQSDRTRRSESVRQPAVWKWAALALALGFIALALRYVEPLVQQRRLATRMTELQSYRQKLPEVERELRFLEFLQTNQPPYLDTISIFAHAAPGTRFDSVSLTRRGDVSLRGTMRDSQQVADFRSKLIASGFFAAVNVDEQTPTPDKQKLVVRMTAQLKPPSARKPLAELEPRTALSAASNESGKTADKAVRGSGSPVTPQSSTIRETKLASTNSSAPSRTNQESHARPE